MKAPKNAISLRITPALNELLLEAAERNGHTLTDEITTILSDHFGRLSALVDLKLRVAHLERQMKKLSHEHVASDAV